MTDKLILHVADARWNALLNEDTIAPIIQKTFAVLAADWAHEIAVVLTDDAQVQELNHTFRGKDKPTNVLSFPSEEGEDAYGDVILAYETVLAEAKEQGKVPLHHVTHLLVHGVLHLLGFDHMEEGEAEEMEILEVKILDVLSIANPYES